MSISWNILNWNIRGINSQERWDDIKQRVEECNCNIICLQETKREHFELSYLRNFCHKKFNKYAFTPSIGSSGSIITIWNGNLFEGTIISQRIFQVTVKLKCRMSGKIWHLTNIYGPAHNENREDFFNWMADLDSSDYHYWMLMGDFNLIRNPGDRNRSGGDSNNMLLFNTVIQVHDLEEIPLKGRSYTWSNMQQNPLLEKT
jgi:exonuclease III